MTYDEIYDWLAYDMVEGIPSEFLSDRRNALAISNLLRPHIKKDTEVNLDMFLLNQRNSYAKIYPPKPKTQEEIAAEVERVFSGMVRRQKREQEKKKNVNSKHRRIGSKG